MSIYSVKFRALGKAYVVRVIARLPKSAMSTARHDLLRGFPNLRQTTVTMVSCDRVGPQIDVLDVEDGD